MDNHHAVYAFVAGGENTPGVRLVGSDWTSVHPPGYLSSGHRRIQSQGSSCKRPTERVTEGEVICGRSKLRGRVTEAQQHPWSLGEKGTAQLPEGKERGRRTAQPGSSILRAFKGGAFRGGPRGGSQRNIHRLPRCVLAGSSSPPIGQPILEPKIKVIGTREKLWWGSPSPQSHGQGLGHLLWVWRSPPPPSCPSSLPPPQGTSLPLLVLIQKLRPVY